MEVPIFSSEHIECYVQDAYPEIEKDKRIIRLRLYVNPISRDRALEVSQELADALFHKLGTEWLPRAIVDRIHFNNGSPKPYSLSFCRHPDYPGDRVFIKAVFISKLEAGKVTPESPDFALMFTVSFEPDDPSVMKDFFQLLHEKIFITFKVLQPSLFEEPDKYADLLCRLCDAPNPEFIVKGSKTLAYCQAHVDQRAEGEEVTRIRNTEKAAAIAQEMNGTAEPEKAKGKDPLLSGADINQKAAGRQRKGVH